MSSATASADYQKGLVHQAGDFATALREWRPYILLILYLWALPDPSDLSN